MIPRMDHLSFQFCQLLVDLLTNFTPLKILLPFLTTLTENECNFTDSFHIAEETCKKVSNLYMVSLDIDYLFTNITLDEP